MCFAFNLMLEWRAMTVTVHLAPWSEGHWGSHVMCHVSRVTCQVSHVTSFFFFFFFTKWWSILVKGLLSMGPRLVYWWWKPFMAQIITIHTKMTSTSLLCWVIWPIRRGHPPGRPPGPPGMTLWPGRCRVAKCHRLYAKYWDRHDLTEKYLPILFLRLKGLLSVFVLQFVLRKNFDRQILPVQEIKILKSKLWMLVVQINVRLWVT